MVECFRLSNEQLVQIAQAFQGEVEEGLADQGRMLRCLPTWCATDLPAQPEPVLVLDVGGTNLRAARMEFAGSRWRPVGEILEARLPVERGRPLPRPVFLAVQADLVARVAGRSSGIPLGYCFSYPTESLRNGDARLLNWTKEVFVPDTEGTCVGEPLLDELRRHGVECSGVTVINDTVASLLAGAPAASGEALIGLIVGTGTNMAALMPVSRVPKVASTAGQVLSLPVNLESGNFHPAFLNEWDDLVDQGSEHPGRQRFEKAVSGAYLGRLLKAACPTAPIDPDAGSQAVVDVASGRIPSAGPAVGPSRQPKAATWSPDMARTATAILNRSARLVGASIAALAAMLPAAGSRCRVVAEGSLFWKAPDYADNVREALSDVLAGLGRSKLQCSIVSVGDANLAGAALGAQITTTR